MNNMGNMHDMGQHGKILYMSKYGQSCNIYNDDNNGNSKNF